MIGQTTTKACIQGKVIAQFQTTDREGCIPYRPEYNQITGDVMGSLLLEQIWYWWSQNGGKPFYKYRAPCKADDYREGESWIEELGCTSYRFGKAINTIATKIKRGDSKSEAYKNAIVIYWTDSNRTTWYEINEELFFTLVGLAYDPDEPLGDADLQDLLGTPKLHEYLASL